MNEITPKAKAGEIPVFCSFDELVPITKLVCNPRNPNKHPQEQIRILAEIIKYQGWRSPITVSKKSGFIVRGHGRYASALLIGAEVVPVDYQDYATDAEEWADLIADNRIAELSKIDETELQSLLEEISETDFDTLITGYSDEDFENLFKTENIAIEDDFEIDNVLQENPIAKTGDIWILGRHRLLCGDCTNKAEILRLMDGKKANLCVTDPPYNCNYTGCTGEKLKIQNDNLSDEEFYNFLLSAFQNVYENLIDGGSFYCFHSDGEKVNFYNATVNSGFHYSTTCIWVKDSLVMGRMDYQMKHEPVIYAFKNTAKHNWYSDRKQTTVWEFARPKKSDIHPTMKPIELIAYPIQNSTQENGIVLDIFGGSGSTLIACEQINRVCFSCEIDPKYASAIIKRYIDLAGNSDEVFVLRNGEKISISEIGGIDNEM
jgi:DNA modification methylase